MSNLFGGGTPAAPALTPPAKRSDIGSSLLRRAPKRTTRIADQNNLGDNVAGQRRLGSGILLG